MWRQPTASSLHVLEEHYDAPLRQFVASEHLSKHALNVRDVSSRFESEA
jgi:hypothetical protein